MRPAKEPSSCSRLSHRNYGEPSEEKKFSQVGFIRNYPQNILAKEIGLFGDEFGTQNTKALPADAVTETSLILSLDLETVVKLEDIEIKEREVKIFMKNLGFSLEHYIDQQEYSEYEAMPIIYSALQTLAEIHSRGVIHSDIKTENFLLSHRNADPILIDFGLAIQSVVLSDGNVRPVVRSAGDPEFEAPELQEKDGITSKIDIWSLALMWIRMIIPIDRQAKLSQEEISRLLEDFKPETKEEEEEILEGHLYSKMRQLRSEINQLLMIGKKYEEGLALLEKHVSMPLFEILSNMLEIDPEKRPSPLILLQNRYFKAVRPNRNLNLLSPREAIEARKYQISMTLNEKSLIWRSNHLIWLFQKCQTLRFSYRIYFLAVKLLDIIWSLNRKLILNETPDVCLSLAQKLLYGFSSIDNGQWKDLSEIIETEVDEKESLKLELKIYELLCFNVNFSTAYDYFLLKEGTPRQRDVLITLLRTPIALMISDWQLAKAALEPIQVGSNLENLIAEETIPDFDWTLIDE